METLSSKLGYYGTNYRTPKAATSKSPLNFEQASNINKENLLESLRKERQNNSKVDDRSSNQQRGVSIEKRSPNQAPTSFSRTYQDPLTSSSLSNLNPSLVFNSPRFDSGVTLFGSQDTSSFRSKYYSKPVRSSSRNEEKNGTPDNYGYSKADQSTESSMISNQNKAKSTVNTSRGSNQTQPTQYEERSSDVMNIYNKILSGIKTTATPKSTIDYTQDTSKSNPQRTSFEFLSKVAEKKKALDIKIQSVDIDEILRPTRDSDTQVSSLNNKRGSEDMRQERSRDPERTLTRNLVINTEESTSGLGRLARPPLSTKNATRPEPRMPDMQNLYETLANVKKSLESQSSSSKQSFESTLSYTRNFESTLPKTTYESTLSKTSYESSLPKTSYESHRQNYETSVPKQYQYTSEERESKYSSKTGASPKASKEIKTFLGTTQPSSSTDTSKSSNLRDSRARESFEYETRYDTYLRNVPKSTKNSETPITHQSSVFTRKQEPDTYQSRFEETQVLYPKTDNWVRPQTQSSLTYSNNFDLNGGGKNSTYYTRTETFSSKNQETNRSSQERPAKSLKDFVTSVPSNSNGFSQTLTTNKNYSEEDSFTNYPQSTKGSNANKLTFDSKYLNSTNPTSLVKGASTTTNSSATSEGKSFIFQSKSRVKSPSRDSEERSHQSTRNDSKPVQYYMASLEKFMKSPHSGDEYFSKIYREHFQQTYQALNFCKFLKQVDPKELAKKKVYLPKKESHRDKKTVIFDLDETLIHCNESSSMPSDVVLPIKFPQGDVIEAGINIRPFALDCLEELSKHFEIIVFTASHSCYANVVLDYLDPQNKYIHHRLFRDNCIVTEEGLYIKDLRIFANRNLKDVVIVDNAVYSFGYQLDNGIPIAPFYYNKNDTELKTLIPYLKNLFSVRDVREINARSFKLHHYTECESQEEVIQKIF